MEDKGKVLVLGLGGAGVRIVSALNRLPEARPLTIYALDTDKAALERAVDLEASRRILGDEQWLSGLGAGGDVMKGQRALSRESGRLRELLNDARLLVVTGGLGGGTATGGAGVIARLAHTMNVPVVFVFELPFAFEGHGRRKAAEDGMRELLALADAVLGLPNDLLFSVLPAETAFVDAFRMADVELARVIAGVVDILTPGNLLAADLGDLSAILKNRKSYAAVGVGVGASETPGEACRVALTTLADSPFLGGAAKLREADAVLLNLTGGPELTLSEVRRTLEAVGALPGVTARVLVGANVREDCRHQVRLTAIAVKFDERDAVEKQLAEAAKPVRRKRSRATAAGGDLPIQPSLPLTISTSGIFEGTTETVIDGVNFDIPTFHRKQIAVDTGE